MKITDIKNPDARRYGKLIDADKDGALSDMELDVAVLRRDPVKERLLERAHGDAWAGASAGLKTGKDLERLLDAAPLGGVFLPGPTLPYDKLFEGPRSEWVVAFGGDDHSAASDKAPPDVSQYRGFKNFLEQLRFKPESRRAGIDESGHAVYTKLIKAPDGHEHALRVKVINSTHLATAADEYMATSNERRGYFSLSHAGEGIGMRIGGAFIRPENMLKSPAPALIIAPIACRSFDHFAPKIAKYMEEWRIPKEKLVYIGSTQEIEMTQSNGAMALLKSAFLSALAGRNMPTILKAADAAYSPIMASYDRAASDRNRDAMVMDAEIAATPVLKGLVDGATVELPKKHSGLSLRAAGAPGG